MNREQVKITIHIEAIQNLISLKTAVKSLFFMLKKIIKNAEEANEI